jgi:hypothetical protein
MGETNDADVAPKPAPRSKRRRRVGGRYLKGPVPWAWLLAAGVLPGKALHVGLALWQQAGCGGTLTASINQSTAASEFGCDRASIHRALATLGHAGLIRVVERRPGRKVVVELLVPNEASP